MVRRITDAAADEHRSVESVALSNELIDRVEARLSRTEFDTVDAYVEFVIEEVLTRVEETADESGDVVSRSEVETRLEALGYLE